MTPAWAVARVLVWRSQFRQLPQHVAPVRVPLAVWQQFLRDASVFLSDRGWGSRAVAAGWDELELFAAHATRPFERLDMRGAIWGLHGDSIAELDEEVICLDNGLKIRRHAIDPGQVALPWELPMPPPPARETPGGENSPL